MSADPVLTTLTRLASAGAGMPVRRTARLVLRPWREEDRAPFAALNADPEVMLHFPAPLDRAQSDAMIDRLRVRAARQGFGMFAVEERGTRAFVGMVGLSVPDWEAPFTPAVEIGWRFARPFWGQGLATEAARDVLDWAFGVLRLARVVSFTVPENERSWRVMERLGMTRVGTFAHPRLPEGDPLQTHVWYTLDAPARVAPPEPPQAAPAPAPKPPLPQVWIDGDGAPRAAKELVWRAVERGTVAATLVANRPVVVPRHRSISTVVVKHGLDVADDWLVAHAAAGDLVVTSDVPLAAELVARGVEVVSPRGERFTPENMGEKLSMRDFFTEARASGLVEGGGPAAFDERARRAFANALDTWIQRARRGRSGG
jgi:uncharacterized protein YaiI (UPF0178 family)/RimJ/RimL family protein N-acetyltransferase